MAAWLRLYTEMMDDPKVGQLTDPEFRTWVGLLCLAGKADASGDTRHTIEQARWSLRRDIGPDLPHLLSLNLIVASPSKTIRITNWSKRQYRSDSSVERVRKHRNGESPLPKQECNGTEQNRTEQIQNRTDGFARFYDAYPKKSGRGQAETAWRKVDASLLDQILAAIEAQKADRIAAAKVGAFRAEWKYPATWLNGQCWLDEIQPAVAPKRAADPAPAPIRVRSPEQEAADRARYEATLKAEAERAARLASEASGDPSTTVAKLKALGVVR